MPGLSSPTASARNPAAVPALLGVWAAAIAVAPGTVVKLLIALPVCAGIVTWWTLPDPQRWLTLFFFASLLLPPLPLPFGNSGVHLAPLFLLPGILNGTLRIAEWRKWNGPLPLLFFVFATILAASTGLAAIYSGSAIAAGSMARVALFAISVFVFMYTYAGPRARYFDPLHFARLLFIFGSLGALFACFDFYYQFPAPAGYGDQFIWVGQVVLRRAQGLFYEASTLGNFCAFFLVMILVAFFRPAEERPCSRVAMALGGGLFACALIFSYSRASLVNVAVASCAFVYIRRVRIRLPAVLGLVLAAGVALMLIRIAMPVLAAHYWTRIQSSFEFFGTAPDRVLSGRLASWTIIGDFLARHPWHVIFGIGYKTLPYTGYVVTGGIVADNTWLSLLAETGIAGVAAFGVLNFAMLRTALKAARSPLPRAAFFGSWIFCFWTGEMVQMLSGDLITYWRVLPLYFWVLATAAREAGE